jgi:hypothetical protein
MKLGVEGKEVWEERAVEEAETAVLEEQEVGAAKAAVAGTGVEEDDSSFH